MHLVSYRPAVHGPARCRLARRRHLDQGRQQHPCAPRMHCERRYFGVVSAQPSGTLDTALPMALLQRLFQLEGQETLEDMLATVLSNRSATVDGNGEEQGWRRVIRVPVTCVPTAQEASTLPPLPQTLRSAFAAVSQPLMSEARSGLSDTLNQTYINLSSPQSELQMHQVGVVGVGR